MSNVKVWFAHMKAQAHAFKAEWHAVRKHRGLLKQLQYIIFSPLLFAIIFILIATFFNALMTIYADQHEHTGYPPLPDRLHNIISQNDDHTIGDTILIVFTVVAVVRFGFWWNGMTFRRMLALVQRFLLLEGLVQILRGFALGGTSYPSPDPNCVKEPDGNIWFETWDRISGDRKTCSDSMFSGHTGMFTLLALFWTFYSQGEEFNVFLPKRWHAKDHATQDERVGATNLTHQQIADANSPKESEPLSPGGRHASSTGAPVARNGGMSAGSVAAASVSFSSASPLSWPPTRSSYHLIDLLLLAIMVLSTLSLIWARYHYTDDIFVGFLVGQGLFRLYHLGLENLARKRRQRVLHGWSLRGQGDAQPDALRMRTEPVPSVVGYDNPDALRYTIYEKFMNWFEQGMLQTDEEVAADLLRTGALPGHPAQTYNGSLQRAPALDEEHGNGIHAKSLHDGHQLNNGLEMQKRV